MSDHTRKLSELLNEKLKDKKRMTILEFGVREGISTKLFLDIVEKKDGSLYSIDIEDSSHLFDSKKWKFIKSRDDNFEYLKDLIPKEFDLIFLDSFHQANHVIKILHLYYSRLKVGGLFIIDDISWLPYTKDKPRNNFFCEINNQETFEELLKLYNTNINNFDLEFSFISTGLAIIRKKKINSLNPKKKILSRKNSIKNFIRKIIKSTN